jgi:hypothetical protein
MVAVTDRVGELWISAEWVPRSGRRSLETPSLFLEQSPAKLSNRGRRDLFMEVTKNLMVTDRALVFLCGDGRTFQKDNHLCSNSPTRPLWSGQMVATPY